MKVILTILLTILTLNLYSQSQNLRIPQRMFNHSLAYGPRGNSLWYSYGYEFNKEKTNATIGLGFGKLMVGLNMFSPEKWVINGKPDEVYVSLNYVYRNKDYDWFMLLAGVGKSVDGNNQLMFRVGADLEISYPFFITTNFYQTNQSQLMIGGKIIIF